MPHQKTLGLEGSKHKEATQKRDGNGRFPIGSGNQTDHQDQTTEQCTMLTTLRATAPADQIDAQISVVFTEPLQEQDQEDAKSREAALENCTKRTDDSTYNPSPSDPITSERTLDFIEDLLTPLQTVPMNILCKTTEIARGCGAVSKQADESLLTTSSELQNIFDGWLVPMTPEWASE